ncbi:MAG: sugar-binding domain-containing protein [Ignavibacteriaceae bacterium]
MKPINVLKLLLFIVFFSTLSIPQTADWQPKKAILMTRWASQVSPQNDLPEYPRPQMVRKDWLNLNGVWQFSEAQQSDTVPFDKDLAERILVPFPIESALSGIMHHVDIMWYRRIFTIPSGWSGNHTLLHFEAVDWETKVYLNGHYLGKHDGGYDPFRFDITNVLNSQGPQEIIVWVYDPTDKEEQPRGKQVLNPTGIWFTGSSGIWQTVWLEPIPDPRIESLKIIPEINNDDIKLTVTVAGTNPNGLVKAVVKENGNLISSVDGYSGSAFKVPVPNPHLWSPDDPFLYELHVYLYKGGILSDSVDSYFGMRQILLGKDEHGITRIMLNGKFLFQIGVLDQGFWPDGLYTAPTDDALKYDIETAKKMGFNTIRKHVKVEPNRWYYWCDKLGVLVWQDMPSGQNLSASSQNEFEIELKNMINKLYNHPSIVIWVLFNEGWGQFNTAGLNNVIKNLDPTRLVDAASGWVDMHVGDIVDSHHYPDPQAPTPEANRAAVIGEFGGGWLEINGHMWTKPDGNGLLDGNSLTNFYVNEIRKVKKLKDSPGISAAIYTEITDVEREYAGFLTYDRDILKCYYFPILVANQDLVTSVKDYKEKGNGENREIIINHNPYPNPFNGDTNISFSLKINSNVKVTIYDSIGRRVKIIVIKQLEKGDYSFSWDGTMDNESVVPSGIYFYSIQTDKTVKYDKLELLK